MRFLSKLIGIGLVILGIYFLSKNIYFTTTITRYWWRDIPAFFSVMSLILGTTCLVIYPRQTGIAGGILIALGIIFVFLSGNVFLRPTSLWYFFVSFSSLTAGLQLIRSGKINI